MDALSIGNQPPSGQAISDRFAGSSVASAVPLKTASPVTTAQAVTATEQAQQPSASKEQINKAVQEINKTIQATSQNLEFSVDHDSSMVVVKLIDQQTKQVLRQIPTQEVLEIAKSLDKLQGLLIKQTA